MLGIVVMPPMFWLTGLSHVRLEVVNMTGFIGRGKPTSDKNRRSQLKPIWSSSLR